MKVTVRISDVEVIIDRPNMNDYDNTRYVDGPILRKNIIEGTVIPMLEAATKSAKELYELKKIS